jgi:PAS domain S-box-containing protein
MYQTNLIGEIKSANKVLCNLLGFKSFSELKKFDSNINRFIKSPERAAFIKAVEKDGFVSGFETCWLTKEQKIIYIRESAKKRILDGEVIYEGTVEDITAEKIVLQQKKQKVKELINIIETVNVPIFGINKNKEIVVWNHFIEETTGYLKNEIYEKKVSHIFIQQIFDNKFIQLIEDILKGKQFTDFEININSKAGEKLKFLLNTTVQHDASEDITGILFIARDVTKLDKYKNELEKKVAERTQELEKALIKEKELNELKSRFVSMASHEFRTPLAAISFAAGFVLKYWHRLDEKTRELKLLKIEEQVKNMISILDGVLTIGKGASGKIKVDRKLYKCKDFFDTIIDEVLSATSSSHQIIFGKTQNNCTIFIDGKIGRKIFINLLSNAIKFSPGANKIIIEYRCENNNTIVDIIDFGIGISNNEIDKVFIPFHRSENADAIRGTGLGLAIVKESVEQLNGTIKLKSEVGKGSRFTVTLPLPKD